MNGIHLRKITIEIVLYNSIVTGTYHRFLKWMGGGHLRNLDIKNPTKTPQNLFANLQVFNFLQFLKCSKKRGRCSFQFNFLYVDLSKVHVFIKIRGGVLGNVLWCYRPVSLAFICELGRRFTSGIQYQVIYICR